MGRNCVRTLLIVGLLLAAAAESAAGTSYTWTATNGGSFQAATSWSPYGPPGSGDFALFNAPATYTVSFGASTTQTYSFTQEQGTVTFAIGAGQVYYASPNFNVGNVSGETANLVVTSGTLSPQCSLEGLELVIGQGRGSTGNLTVTGVGSGFFSYGQFAIGYGGTGTFTAQNNASATMHNVPYVGYGGNGTVTVSSGGTFSAPDGIIVGYGGSGNLAVNGGGAATVDTFSAGLGGSGTVSVGDGTTAASLTVTNNAGKAVSMYFGDTGAGILNVNSGGTLTGAGNVVFGGVSDNNAGSGTGTISGTWNQSNGTISLGTTDGTAVGTGSLTVNNGGALTLSGSGAGITTLAGHGTLTINAGGTVTTPAFTNHGTFNLAGGTLSTGTMNGSGLLNDGTMTVASGPADVYGPVNNTVAGQIINSSGAVLTFHDAVTHNGQAINTTARGRTVFLGAVNGTGPYTGAGTVEYDGAVNPASSPALVTYAGDLALGSTAALDVVLGGTTAGSQYDQFAVTGAATLDGALNVALINGFTPQPGQEFDILTYGAHSGDFSSFSGLDLGNGYELTPTPGPNMYSLVVTPVPEPSATALLGATAVIMLWRRRRSG